MRFRDISIRIKLLVGFLIIAILLVITGYLGTSSMKKINRQSEIMYTDNLQVIDNIHKVRYKVMDTTVAVKDLMNVKDKSEIQALEERIESNRFDSTSYFKIIECKLVTGQEIELWKLFKEEVHDSNKNIKELIHAIEDDNIGLSNSIAKELRVDSELMHDQLSRMIAENSTKARIKTDTANRIYTNTSRHMNTIIVVGFIGAMGLGMFLSRYIAEEINIGLEFAEALGKGDLTYDIGKNDTKDEIGQLMSSLGEGQDKLKALILAVSKESERVFNSSQNLSQASKNAEDATSKIIHDFEHITEDIYNMDSVVERLDVLVKELEISLAGVDRDLSLLEKNMEEVGGDGLKEGQAFKDIGLELLGTRKQMDTMKETLNNLSKIEDEIISNFSESTSTSREILLELNVSSNSLEEIRNSISTQIMSVEKLHSKMNEFKL